MDRQCLFSTSGFMSHEHSVPQGRPRKRPDTDFHIVHLGHHFRMSRTALLMAISTMVVVFAWAAASLVYVVFHDEALASLRQHEVNTQVTYEERIEAMRTEIARLSSRSMLDRETLDGRLESLMKRQAALEARHAAMAELTDPTAAPATRAQRAASPAPNAASGGPLVPAPASDTVILIAPDKEARLESRMAVSPLTVASLPVRGEDPVPQLVKVEESLRRVETQQSTTLNLLEEKLEQRIRRSRVVLAELGLGNVKAASASGGPFIPAPGVGATSFDLQFWRVSSARAQLRELEKSLSLAPVRRPIAGDLEMTSGYGVRVDPFVGRPALHSGVDWRASVGEPVHVTAAGTVVTAGREGGYGLMVEVDHGNGLTTRYGHLSAISVSEGQKIAAGTMVGRVGSTGRSTGPHLHYETRINGDAVDPQRFLRAGLRLSGTL